MACETCGQCNLFKDGLCDGQVKFDDDECPIEIKVREQKRKRW